VRDDRDSLDYRMENNGPSYTGTVSGSNSGTAVVVAKEKEEFNVPPHRTMVIRSSPIASIDGRSSPMSM
jgi:hypothetical protein